MGSSSQAKNLFEKAIKDLNKKIKLIFIPFDDFYVLKKRK
jgi:hypothetical protein